MTDLSEQEMESIAASYEKLLVPGFFDDYAEKTLDEVQPDSGETVLDVACGTGVLGRADVDGWFPLAGIEFEDRQVDEVIRRARRELDDTIAEDGSVEFTMPALLVTNT